MNKNLLLTKQLCKTLCTLALLWLSIASVKAQSCAAPTNLTVSSITREVDKSTFRVELSWLYNTTNTYTTWEYQWGTTPTYETNPNNSKGAFTHYRGDNGKLSTGISGLQADSYFTFFVRAKCGDGTYTAWVGRAFKTPPAANEMCPSNIVTFPTGNDFERVDQYNWPYCVSRDGNNSVEVYSNDRAHSGTRYLGLYSLNIYGFSSIYSRRLYLQGGKTYRISGYYKTGSTASNPFKVVVNSDPSEDRYSTIQTIATIDNVNQSNWQLISGTFSPVIGGYYYIGYVHGPGTNNTQIYLDDIRVEEACAIPRDLTANTTAYEATLNWTQDNTASGWEIEYGKGNFSLGTGTKVIVTSKPHTLSGLSSNTEYTYRVRSICNVENKDTSAWSARSAIFNTKQVCTTPPSNLNASTTSTTANLSWTAGSATQEWLIDYGIGTFTAGSGTKVRVSSNPDTTLSGLIPNTDYTYYVMGSCGEVDNSVWSEGRPFRTAPPCTAPTSLTATNVTTTSANLGWTSTTGSQWQIDYGAGSFTAGNGTKAVVNSNPYTLSGLTANTTYTYYVRSICAEKDTSAWSTEAGSFKTRPINDEASGALSITVGDPCSGNLYSNVNASQSSGEPYASCTNSSGGKTVWYKFVAPTSGSVKISTDYFTGTLSDTRLALFSASDPSQYNTFQIINCDDDNGIRSTGTRSIMYAVSLIPGTTYYIQVDGKTNLTQGGTFCLTVEELTSAMLPTTSSCTSLGGQGLNMENTYTGWASLTDGNGNLIAMVRNTTSTNGTSSYDPARLTALGGEQLARTYNGHSYLHRNYSINRTITGETPSSVDIRFFFTAEDLTILNASLHTLNVTRQTGNTCLSNYDASRGTNSLLSQTSNGNAEGMHWIQVNTPGFSNFYIHSGGYVLPITLKEFKAENSGSANKLSWSTADEAKEDRFVVERSTDGINFTALTEVAAQGTPSQYSYVDQSPVNGANYYRLKLVHYGQNHSYSPIVRVNVGSAKTAVEVYPNPAHDQVSVRIQGSIGAQAQIRISDLNGKTLRTIRVSNSTVVVDMSSLPAGIYLLHYSDEKRSEMLKVTKH